MKKIYYQMMFTAKSPLHIGNGSHEFSDSDLMLDGRGLPFIPGTSIAGIIRHQAEEQNKDKAVLKRLFGIVEIAEKPDDETVSIPSAIFVNDAVLGTGAAKKDFTIGRRDGIKLGEWGTVEGTSKYDFQTSESDREFCAIVEWTGDEHQEKAEIDSIIDPVMKHYVSRGFRTGARTSRGYGDFEVTIRKKSFSFPAELEDWIRFNPYEKDAFLNVEKLEGVPQNIDKEIEICFRMEGAFSVRVNTARTNRMEDGSVPDTMPLENHRGNPVIPGTAWAGAFRHHMHDLLRDAGFLENSSEMENLDLLFGMADNAWDNKKSAVRFSESEIRIESKAEQKASVMRTAVERFTASPRTASLFTGMVYSGGNGKLHISFKESAVSDRDRQLLAACICDMHLGLLTVGGEASVGRGIMKVTGLKVNGIDRLSCMVSSAEGKEPLDWLKEEKRDA